MILAAASCLIGSFLTVLRFGKICGKRFRVRSTAVLLLYMSSPDSADRLCAIPLSASFLPLIRPMYARTSFSFIRSGRSLSTLPASMRVLKSFAMRRNLRSSSLTVASE
ncbi:MAG: hypothetical protein NT137_00215 [Methanomassiliicoccales archaeon]|nr:hypothetical protein [Methanomassiliicoccales archaeon]